MICSRCLGKGIVRFRFGKPGQDTHAKYSDIEWLAPFHRICPVCSGGGRRHSRRPITGTHHFDDDLEAFEEETQQIISDWGLDD